MVEWTKEALAAFERAWHDTYTTQNAQRRAALNAALKAQGILSVKECAEMACAAGARVEKHHAYARAEALEEAAKVAEGSFAFDIETWMNSTKKEMTAHLGNAIAAAIRALKDKPEETP